jgi:tripartite-type tricarboxylate transporter receptor subunit TctC
MKSYFRIVVSALLAALLFPIATIVHSAYPERPIRVIVVFPPGGSNDVTARIVFNKMPDIVGQQFVIENRGGAAGSLGAAVVAQSPADGYTIMVQSTTHIANAFMYKGKLPYDTLGDFIGLTPMARQVGMLVVHPSMPVESIKDLIALAKERPKEINYGTAGLGSFVHLNMAMFLSLAKIEMTQIPYRGGGPSAIALMSGETQVTISTIGSAYRYINAKRMRPLGVTSKERNPKFPDIPAIGEVVPGFEFTAWVGAFVPAGTPQAIVSKLNLDLKKALADPQVVKALTNVTLDPMYMTPEQFAERLKSDYARYEELMRQIGVVK